MILPQELTNIESRPALKHGVISVTLCFRADDVMLHSWPAFNIYWVSNSPLEGDDIMKMMQVGGGDTDYTPMHTC